MTKRKLALWFRVAVAFYFIATFLGFVIRLCDTTSSTLYYATFKDMIPLIIAMPAVWLAYCIQRRASYLQQLRVLWSCLVEAVQYAIHYTYIEKPSLDQRLDILRKLSIAIDEVRGVFSNLKQLKEDGALYPFEPIKNIYLLIQDLNPDASTVKRKETGKKIFILWKEVREELLKEFDQEIPSFSHSHWADPEKVKVYDQFGIEKKVT